MLMTMEMLLLSRQLLQIMITAACAAAAAADPQRAWHCLAHRAEPKSDYGGCRRRHGCGSGRGDVERLRNHSLLQAVFLLLFVLLLLEVKWKHIMCWWWRWRYWWQCLGPLCRRAADGCAPVGAVSTIAAFVVVVATGAELFCVDTAGKDVCTAAAVANENVVCICK